MANKTFRSFQKFNGRLYYFLIKHLLSNVRLGKIRGYVSISRRYPENFSKLDDKIFQRKPLKNVFLRNALMVRVAWT